MSVEKPGRPRVLIIGAGIAGMAAAVAAAEACGDSVNVTVIDRGNAEQIGGNTRWTSAFFRLEDVYEPGDNFVSDIVAFSDRRTPEWYVQALASLLPDAMDWVQSHGARFHRAQTYFINSSRGRIGPIGGGEALLRALRGSAERLGVEVRMETTGRSLLHDDSGVVRGVRAEANGAESDIEADAVIIASGGFEGDDAALRRYFGAGINPLRPIAPGGYLNRGEGIEMAMAIGAGTGGEWESFHAEPVDPRSTDPEPVVMTFPYGILLDEQGERFVDEGRSTVDEIYESVARTIWRRGNGRAYLICDQHTAQCTEWDRGVLTSVRPVRAATIEELARSLGLPVERTMATVQEFNAAVVPGPFDWRAPDGKHTAGLEPDKSNWATPLDEPPFFAYPIECSIVFTFGGLLTDVAGQVTRDDGTTIPGLYAAGECTGIYYGKYPGGTSVMRGLVFGREAGRSAAKEILATVGAS